MPLRYWSSSIDVVELDGKGRGVVARTDILPGTLLMLCSPLLFVEAPEGEDGTIPDSDELLEQLYNRPLSPLDRALIAALHNGQEGQGQQQHVEPWLPDFAGAGTGPPSPAPPSGAGAPDAASRAGPSQGPGAPGGTTDAANASSPPAPPPPLPATGAPGAAPLAVLQAVPQVVPQAVPQAVPQGVPQAVPPAVPRRPGAPGGMPDAVAAAGADDGGGDDGVRALTLEELGHEARAGALALNAYGEVCQDMVLTLARARARGAARGGDGGEGRGHVGLWPEFSMLNHSCAPNATNFTVDDRMVVRAALHIPQGSEVNINYLGRGALAPVGQRQGALLDTYGFECACPRCAAEAPGKGGRLQAAGAAAERAWSALVDELGPALEDAGALGDGVEARAVAASLVACVGELDRELGSSCGSSSGGGGASAGGVAGVDAAVGEGGGAAAVWAAASAFEVLSAQCTAYDLLIAIESWQGQQGGERGGEQQQQQEGTPQQQGEQQQGGQQQGEQQGKQQQEGTQQQQGEQQQRQQGAQADGLSGMALAAAHAASVARLLSIAASASPLSDLHLMLAVKALSLSQQRAGPESEHARSAEAEAVRVLQGRYGPVGDCGALGELLVAASAALDRTVL
ncbi:hypothetical protein FOA52_011930 [Chlamydomonas sp. UWO 241]|nr:hypothetical protein FOA52_011930 [Chlamydomonas sp. UWO 241]